jgi:hypothetical protein
MKIEIVKAEHEHIAPIAEGIRPEDRQEMYDYMKMAPLEAIERSFQNSERDGEAWTGIFNGVPCCIFGVAVQMNINWVWFVATDVVDQHPHLLLIRNRKFFKRFFGKYHRLENYVSEENKRAIQWLKWLKFEFAKPQPMGAFNKNSLHFWLEA